MSKSLNVPRGTARFESLAEYIRLTGKRKNFVATVELQIDPPRLSELLTPEVYRPRVDDDLADRIAQLLNQKPDYVRKIYPKAA